MKIWIFAAALATAPASHGAPPSQPQSLNVGDGAADGSWLTPYENAWLYTVRFPDGRVKTQGIWSDHVERTTVDGRAVLKRVQGMTYVNAMTSSGITVMDAKTCAPVTTEQHRPDGLVIKRTFDGAHVVTERTAPGEKVAHQTAVDLPAPVFDYYGGAYGFLISCFPLKVGYSATFPAIGETDDVPDPVKFAVVKREKVRAGAKGMVQAYVVIADHPGEYTQTFWLSKTPPYIIRLVITFPDKSKTISFDMI